jgi:hypothetical protein
MRGTDSNGTRGDVGFRVYVLGSADGAVASIRVENRQIVPSYKIVESRNSTSARLITVALLCSCK